MKSAVSSFTALVAFMLLSSSVFAQTRDWDSILDRYESICAECVAMKARVADGGRVSKRKLASIVEELGVLRSIIQEGAGEMSGAQKSRFDGIRGKYPSVNRPVARELGHRQPVAGSVAELRPVGTVKKTVATARPAVPDDTVMQAPAVERGKDVQLPEMPYDIKVPARIGKSLSSISAYPHTALQTVEVTEEKYVWSLGVSSGLYPDFTAGAFLTFDMPCGILGAYVSCRGDFNRIDAAYDCLSDGTADGSTMWTNGVSRRHRFAISAGPVVRITQKLSLYAGAGYGRFACYWEDIDGKWAEVSDITCSGLSLDTGLLYDIGIMRIGIGAGITAFRYSDLAMSLGIRF